MWYTTNEIENQFVKRWVTFLTEYMLNYLRSFSLQASTTARILVFFGMIFTSYKVDARHIVRLDKSSTVAIEEREAIVILTGFGSLYHSAKNQVKNFKDQGFDLFIPDYIDRQSLADCSSNLEKFIEKNKLKSYKKVHVFAYIIGGWTLNTYLTNHEWKNLASVVYDRSSLQETLPGILSRDNPFFSRVLFGPLIKNLAETPYFSTEIPTAKIGLLIECKATKVLWKKKKSFDKLPPISFDVASFNQPNVDFFYTYQSHDDLYTSLEYPAPAIIEFFRTGKFSANMPRKAIDRDPFETYQKK